MAEHRKETEKISDRNFTRATSRAPASEDHKSAIINRPCVPEQSHYGLGLKQVK